MDKRYIRPDGSIVDAAVISVLVEPEGAEAHFFSQLQDVTEQRRAERQKAVIADIGRCALESTDAVALMADAMHVVRESLQRELPYEPVPRERVLQPAPAQLVLGGRTVQGAGDDVGHRAWRIGRCSLPSLRPSFATLGAWATASAFWCSTSTASRSSTTRSDTRSVTRSCAKWPRG